MSSGFSRLGYDLDEPDYSFPNDLGYGDDLPPESIKDENIPRILLTGQKRAGKSSILKVVFQKASPNETFFLESTTQVTYEEVSHSSFVKFEICDTPGDLDMDMMDPADNIFHNCSTLVYVIDATDDYQTSLDRMNSIVTKAHSFNPNIKFEVFIHKVEDLSEDHKLEVQRNISLLARDELRISKLDSVHLNFYLTSVYDHSILVAFSKVIQKLIPQLPVLENLLDILISNCRMEKAFLIDVVSKIFLATDSNSVETQTYELCSDMIDVVIDILYIYGNTESDNDETQAVIKLSNNTVLYLREINKYLVLVCWMKDSKFDKHGLIDYNVSCLKEAITRVFENDPNQ